MRVLEIRFLILLLLAVGMVPCAGGQSSLGKTTLSPIKKTGTTVMGESNPAYRSVFAPMLKVNHNLAQALRNWTAIHSASSARPASAPLPIPFPTLNPVRNREPRVGFKGLTTVNTAFVDGLVPSPPDQGLCAGHVFVTRMQTRPLESQ